MLSLSEIYMLATLAVAALCWLAKALDRRADEVFTAALIVLLLSSVTAIARTFIHQPFALAVHPVEDLLCVVLFSGAYIANRSRWAAALVVLFTTQLFLHAGFWTTGDFSSAAHKLYAIKINAVFIVVLVTLAMAGGAYVVRHCVGRLGLSRRGAMVRLQGAR